MIKKRGKYIKNNVEYSKQHRKKVQRNKKKHRLMYKNEYLP